MPCANLKRNISKWNLGFEVLQYNNLALHDMCPVFFFLKNHSTLQRSPSGLGNLQVFWKVGWPNVKKNVKHLLGGINSLKYNFLLHFFGWALLCWFLDFFNKAPLSCQVNLFLLEVVDEARLTGLSDHKTSTTILLQDLSGEVSVYYTVKKYCNMEIQS